MSKKGREKSNWSFEKYMTEPPKYVRMVDENTFEVEIGTKRKLYKDCLSQAGMCLIKDSLFRVHRDGRLEVVSYKKDNPEYMDDNVQIQVMVLQSMMPDYISKYQFSPETFAQYAKFIMRPICKKSVPKNRKEVEKTIKIYQYAA